MTTHSKHQITTPHFLSGDLLAAADSGPSPNPLPLFFDLLVSMKGREVWLAEMERARLVCLEDREERRGMESRACIYSSHFVASTLLIFSLLSMEVQELQPDSAVSLIDTDMEAQVVPSLETEQVSHVIWEYDLSFIYILYDLNVRF